MKVLETGVLIILIIVLPTYCVSCNKQDDVLPFFVSDCGQFQTQDLERAQEEVSFTIVLPQCLPGNMPEQPWIMGLVGDAPAYIKNRIEIRYQATGNIEEGYISIYEYESGGWLESTEKDPDIMTIDVNSVEVIKQSHIETWLSSEGSIEIFGFIFKWHTGDVNYYVEIYGYDNNEAYKVIESMI